MTQSTRHTFNHHTISPTSKPSPMVLIEHLCMHTEACMLKQRRRRGGGGKTEIKLLPFLTLYDLRIQLSITNTVYEPFSLENLPISVFHSIRCKRKIIASSGVIDATIACEMIMLGSTEVGPLASDCKWQNIERKKTH